MGSSVDFPRIDDEEAEKGLLFLRQFVWLHQYVLSEIQNKEGKNEEA